MTGPLYAIGRFCSRHRYPVIGAWVVLAIVLLGLGQAGGSKTSEAWLGFDEELQRQAKTIQEGFERDHARSMMVFDRKTLVLAQRARAAKKRVHLARKYAASMERWRAAEAKAAKSGGR